MTVLVPLVSKPSQTLSIILSQQACRINVYQKTTGLFLDLYVNDALLIGGAICLSGVAIVRDGYLGFAGELAFYDLLGLVDPDYTKLGSRFVLAYFP